MITTKACEFCGEDFTADYRARFCSRSCGRRADGKNLAAARALETEKTCSKCEEVFPIEEFAFKDETIHLRQVWCKACSKIYKDEYYQKNKKSMIAKAQVVKKKYVSNHKAMKHSLSCSWCSEKNPATIHFHHLDPETKTLNVSQIVAQQMSADLLASEIEKCIPLCSNCHLKEHFGKAHYDVVGPLSFDGLEIIKHDITLVEMMNLNL